jgi:hypothetical protein
MYVVFVQYDYKTQHSHVGAFKVQWCISPAMQNGALRQREPLPCACTTQLPRDAHHSEGRASLLALSDYDSPQERRLLVVERNHHKCRSGTYSKNTFPWEKAKITVIAIIYVCGGQEVISVNKIANTYNIDRS